MRKVPRAASVTSLLGRSFVTCNQAVCVILARVHHFFGKNKRVIARRSMCGEDKFIESVSELLKLILRYFNFLTTLFAVFLYYRFKTCAVVTASSRARVLEFRCTSWAFGQTSVIITLCCAQTEKKERCKTICKRGYGKRKITRVVCTCMHGNYLCASARAHERARACVYVCVCCTGAWQIWKMLIAGGTRG